MNNKKATKRALLTSVMALVMCVVMLAGTTFAWFTDTASTGVNKIQAGNLDVDIVGEDGKTLDGKTLNFVNKENQSNILWEPGATFFTQGFQIVNKGNLALKYKVVVSGTTGDAKLLEAIDFAVVTDNTKKDAEAVSFAEEGKLLNKGDTAPESAVTDAGAKAYYYLRGHMKEEAGNEYKNLTMDGISITVYATQYTHENDSFGPDYDKNATYYPVLDAAGMKDALVNGGNIKVDANVDPSEALVATKDTTIDMNGKTIANTKDVWEKNPKSWSLISARESADLTITGNGTFAAKKDDCYAVDVQDGATVTIENGTFIGNIHAVYVLKGTAYIKGGFYSVQQKYPDASKANEFVLNCYDANRANGTAKIIVTGGTFVNFNPANCQAEGPNTNFVASGYSVITETKANGDKWFTVVKGTGATVGTQEDLTNAITNNTTSTVKLTTAGTYTLPDELQGKDITVIGTKDTVVNMASNDCYHADNVSLEGVTVEFANEDYRGFKHTGKLTYKDCTITGKQFLYGTEVEFINCTFVQDAVDYNVWTYGAGSVLFKDCTFDCKGKAVLIYNEGHISSQNVEFQNCKFNASTPVADKAAIEIDSRFTSYNVTIDKATSENVSGFGTSTASGSSVWNVKAQGTNTTVTVTIDGAKVN
jgi:predicted ribosomally synthesized peptide with SipW-like signal peptide